MHYTLANARVWLEGLNNVWTGLAAHAMNLRRLKCKAGTKLSLLCECPPGIQADQTPPQSETYCQTLPALPFTQRCLRCCAYACLVQGATHHCAY